MWIKCRLTGEVATLPTESHNNWKKWGCKWICIDTKVSFSVRWCDSISRAMTESSNECYSVHTVFFLSVFWFRFVQLFCNWFYHRIYKKTSNILIPHLIWIINIFVIYNLKSFIHWIGLALDNIIMQIMQFDGHQLF